MENSKVEIKKPSPAGNDREANQTQPIIPDKNIDPELFRPRSCLDRGFVRLVDYMGSDQSIVQAARVSYGRGTKKVSLDRGLIRYLMRHSHTSPFEMVEFKFHVKLPIFVARQWIRHRTANVNEYSGRYSVMEDEFYIPKPGDIHHQSKTNRQGRAETEPTDDLRNRFSSSLKQTQAGAYREYEEFIQEDIARELARINLPLSLYTQWYWKIDLHNLFHFLRLRLDDHSQYEIRVYGQAIAEIVRKIVPNAYEAFEDYQLDSVTFSRIELKYFADKLAEDVIDESRAKECGISKREIAELGDKIERIKKLRE